MENNNDEVIDDLDVTPFDGALGETDDENDPEYQPDDSVILIPELTVSTSSGLLTRISHRKIVKNFTKRNE